MQIQGHIIIIVIIIISVSRPLGQSLQASLWMVKLTLITIYCVFQSHQVFMECSYCLIVLYKLLYNVCYTYPRESVYVFDILSTLTFDQWTMFSPLSNSVMVLLKPAQTTLSLQFSNNCAIQTSLHGYVRGTRLKDLLSTLLKFTLLCCTSVTGRNQFMIFMFLKVAFEICFYQNMFLPCRLYRDKN